MTDQTQTDDCPTCGTDMEQRSAGGHDSRGLPQAATWQQCPDCQTVVDEFGGVLTPADVEADQ